MEQRRQIRAVWQDRLRNLSVGRDRPGLRGRSIPPELPAQLVLGPHQRLLARRGQVPAGTIDVEGEHGQRRAERIGLTAFASFGRPLQRCRDPFGVTQGEHAAVERERIAVLRHSARPATAAPRARHRRPPRGPRFPAAACWPAPRPPFGWSCRSRHDTSSIRKPLRYLKSQRPRLSYVPERLHRRRAALGKGSHIQGPVR